MYLCGRILHRYSVTICYQQYFLILVYILGLFNCSIPIGISTFNDRNIHLVCILQSTPLVLKSLELIFVFIFPFLKSPPFYFVIFLKRLCLTLDELILFSLSQRHQHNRSRCYQSSCLLFVHVNRNELIMTSFCFNSVETDTYGRTRTVNKVKLYALIFIQFCASYSSFAHDILNSSTDI